jgi:hypothetical protein
MPSFESINAVRRRRIFAKAQQEVAAETPMISVATSSENSETTFTHWRDAFSWFEGFMKQRYA